MTGNITIKSGKIFKKLSGEQLEKLSNYLKRNDKISSEALEKAKATNKASKVANNSVKRVTHSKHHPNSVSPEPENVEELFQNAVTDDTGVRWARSDDGIIHRFSSPSNGETHWNGSTAGELGIKPESIPNSIRKFFK